MTFLNCSAYQLFVTDWSTVIPLIRNSLSRHRHSTDDLARSNLHGSRSIWTRPSFRFPDIQISGVCVAHFPHSSFNPCGTHIDVRPIMRTVRSARPHSSNRLHGAMHTRRKNWYSTYATLPHHGTIHFSRLSLKAQTATANSYDSFT